MEHRQAKAEFIAVVGIEREPNIVVEQVERERSGFPTSAASRAVVAGLNPAGLVPNTSRARMRAKEAVRPKFFSSMVLLPAFLLSTSPLTLKLTAERLQHHSEITSRPHTLPQRYQTAPVFLSSSKPHSGSHGSHLLVPRSVPFQSLLGPPIDRTRPPQRPSSCFRTFVRSFPPLLTFPPLLSAHPSYIRSRSRVPHPPVHPSSLPIKYVSFCLRLILLC